MNPEQLTEYFANLFKTETKNIICDTLDMRQKDFHSLTNDELKEYFPLVEMLRI